MSIGSGLPTRVDRGVHLVLGAGGVRALAYLGALQALDEANVPVRTVSGCSAGSVVAVLVAAGLRASDLVDVVAGVDLGRYDTADRSLLHRLVALRRWPFSPSPAPGFARFVDDVLRRFGAGGAQMPLGELALPFASLAIDLTTSDFAVFSSSTHPHMTVGQVVDVATSMPFVHPPTTIGSQVLVDAAVASQLPVWIAASFAEVRPIVALRTKPHEAVRRPRRPDQLVLRLVDSMVTGRDETFLTGNPWVHTIDIDRADVPAHDFDLGADEKRRLVRSGYEAARRYLDSVDGELLPVPRMLPDPTAPARAEGISGAALVRRFRTTARPARLFVSYPHDDTRSLVDVRAALTPLEQGGLVEVWTDEDIPAGSTWFAEIQQAMARADVAMLLISDGFYRSRFIQGTELPALMARAEQGRTELLWVPLERLAPDITLGPLADVQAAWDPQRPLASLDATGTREALAAITRAVVLAAQRSAVRR